MSLRRVRLALWILSAVLSVAAIVATPVRAVEPVELFRVPHYCEGVVFDHAGRGYVSEGDRIWWFELDGRHEVFAITGAPNGHKILANGTHLVCDASRHAVLRLDTHGKELRPAATACGGLPLRGPNDLSLDTATGGFYFTDPGGSSDTQPIGTVHYVTAAGQVRELDGGLAFPNGIVLTPDGKRLFLAESKHNRVLVYDVAAPGQLDAKRVYAELPAKAESAGQIDNQPDGMCLDAAGNLYVAHYGMKQVQVIGPDGKLIEQLPGGNLTTSNVAFGGPELTQLFVTGGLVGEGGSEGGLFRLDLGRPGLRILPAAK